MKLAFATLVFATIIMGSVAQAGYCTRGETSITFFGKVANAKKQIDLATGASVCTFQIAIKMIPLPPQETPECPLFREDVEQMTLVNHSCMRTSGEDISGVLSLNKGVVELSGGPL